MLRVVRRATAASAAFVFGLDGDTAAAASFAAIRSGGSSHVRLQNCCAEFCTAVDEGRKMAILGLDTAFKKALFLGYMSLWVSRKSALPNTPTVLLSSCARTSPSSCD